MTAAPVTLWCSWMRDPVCLSIQVLFKLPLRQTTGTVARLLKMVEMEWAVPDDTTLWRPQRTLAVQIPYRRGNGGDKIRRCYTAIIDRQATAIIPIRKNGLPWTEDCPAALARNETLRATRNNGRAFWKQWTRYHFRSRIEAKMRCLTAFGERIVARYPNCSTAEVEICIALLNRFSAHRTAKIVRVG